MTIKQFGITALLFLTLGKTFSQQANNWFTGVGCGLNFSTTSASTLSGGQTSGPDNTSTMSDAAGNLLFYTNGVNVWNKNHVVMSNGSGLVGHISAGQCAVIVPIPCNANKYVIFHVTEFSNPGYLNYSVVDMSLNGGLGDVVANQKNVSLGSGWTEKLCAIYNPSANSFWVLTHKWNSSDFVAFNVSANGIATQTVVTSIGSVHNCGTYSSLHDAMGQLTISRDGSKVINALTCSDVFEVFNFNLSTGVLSNSISLTGDGGGAWGTAFSPNSSVVYCNSIFGNKVYQFDLSNYTSSAVAASKYTVTTQPTGGYVFGYMELAPNNQLLIAKPGTNYMSAITNPNALGSASGFSLVGQSLGSNVSSHGTSRIAYNVPAAYSGSVAGAISISSSYGSYSVCPGQTITLNATGAVSYTWNTGSTSSSIQIAPLSTLVYSVSGPNICNNAMSQASVVVVVTAPPSVTISGSPTVCAGSSVLLTANGANSYTWSNGANTQSTVVTPTSSSVYSLNAGVALAGCATTASYYISVVSTPILQVSASPTICPGQSTTLSVSGASIYLWSTNLSGSLITVSPSVTTTYSVAGSNTTACQSNTNVTVVVHPPVNLQVSGSGSLCAGNPATLSVTGANTYSWNNVAGSPVFTVIPTATTVYTVVGVNNQSHCSGKATATLTVRECLGLDKTMNNNIEWKVFPNPFNNRFEVEYSGLDGEETRVYLINALGQVVYTFEHLTEFSKLEIETGNLPSGIYLLTLVQGSNRFDKRLIKQ